MKRCGRGVRVATGSAAAIRPRGRGVRVTTGLAAAVRLRALAVALAAVFAAPAGLGRDAVQPLPLLPSDSDRSAWEMRVRGAREAVARASARRDAAETAYDRMRHRDYPRGKAAAAVEAERSAARAAVEAANRSLEDLLEEARRAGVPPGWLRAESAEPAPQEPRRSGSGAPADPGTDAGF